MLGIMLRASFSMKGGRMSSPFELSELTPNPMNDAPPTACTGAHRDATAAAADAGQKCNPVHPDAPGRTAAQPSGKSDGTNPRPLKPVQLRAARILVRGIDPIRVARKLNVARQTVWRWRWEPAFCRELQRLQDLVMLRPAGAQSSLKRPTPRSAARKSSPAQEEREVNAMVAELLAWKPPAKPDPA
jgi:hypothetical protein